MKKILIALLFLYSCSNDTTQPSQRMGLLAAPGTKTYLKQGYQNGVEITRAQAPSFAQYDTLALKGIYGPIEITGLYGRDSLHPIIIVNEGAINVKRINLNGCRNIKLIGVNNGFVIQGDPKLIVGGFGVDIYNNSSNIEITGLDINHLAAGIHITSPVYCANQDSLNRKGGGIIRDIYIHDNYIAYIWYEGMYISTTSPNNHNNDPRIPYGCDNYRPEPARVRNVRVIRNTVLWTGRGGIQFGAVDGVAEIAFNTVKYSGMNGNDAQGTGISAGIFTHAYIHDNTVVNSFTNNIGLLGGSGRVENNTLLDSNFQLKAYNYKSVEEGNKSYIDPATEPRYVNNAAALYGNQTSAIYFTTRPTIFKDPIRNETRGYMDSAGFQIAGNKFGLVKGKAIYAEDGYSMSKKTGNCISGNTLTSGGAASFAVETHMKYSTTCSVTPPPIDPLPPVDTVKPPVPPTPKPPKEIEKTIILYKDSTWRYQ